MRRQVSASEERRNFISHRHGLMLHQVKEMTADDWQQVYLAHEAFIHQVRAIVWNAQHRRAKAESEFDV